LNQINLAKKHIYNSASNLVKQHMIAGAGEFFN